MNSTDTERAEIRGIVEAVLKRYTREMEGYSYFSSNPGVREDDCEEIAEEIEKAISARRAPSADRGEIVVTKNDAGHIVAVTRQDEEGRILSVLSMSAPIYSAAPVELPEPDMHAINYSVDGEEPEWMEIEKEYRHDNRVICFYHADTVRALLAAQRGAA